MVYIIKKKKYKHIVHNSLKKFSYKMKMFLIDDSLIETPFKVFSNLNMKIFSPRQPNETCLEFKNTKKNNYVFFWCVKIVF